MSFYQHHVFFCSNQREDGCDCCASHNAKKMRDHAKQRCKALGIHEPGKVRINNAGCLNRCSEGPVLVIYPEGTWYTYVDKEDVDEIIDKHLLQGQVVKRLQI